MNIHHSRQYLLVAVIVVSIVATALWVGPSLQRRAEPFSPGTSNSVDSSHPGADDSPRTDPAKTSSLTSSTSQVTTVAKVLTQADRERVDAEIQKVRDLMHEMDRRNSQTLQISGRPAYKLQPLTEEQLDLMYNALTRAAATFESGSAGEKEFRDEALSVINEFRNETANDTTGKFTLLMAAKGENQVPSAMILSADAVFTEKPDGAVELNASEATFSSFKDWNDPDSKSRRRYGHLLEGR